MGGSWDPALLLPYQLRDRGEGTWLVTLTREGGSQCVVPRRPELSDSRLLSLEA